MRRWVLLLIVLLVLGTAAGCGNARKTDSAINQQKVDQNTDSRPERQLMQSPEAKLGRVIIGIVRIQGSETPFTKEQSEKLISLLKDIKAKETISDEYATKKIDEINAILTEKQKDVLSQRPEFFNRNRQNGDTNNMQLPGPWRRNEGNNDAQGNRGRGFNLKDLCDRAITALQK